MTVFPKPIRIPIQAHPDESLMSVIARSAFENVIEHPRELLSLAELKTGLPEFLPFVQVSEAGRLSALLSLEQQQVRSRMHGVQPSQPGWVEWFGTRIPRQFLEARKRRFSPASLRFAAYHRAVWMIRPLPFCPESMEHLVWQCSSCGGGAREQGWAFARGIDRCDYCESPLCDVSSCQIDEGLWPDARAAASLVAADGIIRASALSALPAPFCSWEPGEVFAAAVELGTLLSAGFDKAKGRRIKKLAARGNFTEFSTANLVQGYRFVAAWPQSLSDYLPLVLVKGSLSVQTLAGPFGKFFVKGTRDTPLRALMRESILALLSKHDLERSRKSGTCPRWARSSDYLSQAAAAKAFRLEKPTLKLLANVGMCAQPFSGLVRFHSKSLAQSVAIRRSSMRGLECAWALGVPPYCIESLAAHGLIRNVEDHDALLMTGESLYERSSVENLKAALSALQESGRNGTAVLEVMWPTFHPDFWSLVVAGMLDGTLRVQTLGGQQLVSQTIVDCEDAAQLVQHLPAHVHAQHDGTVSCRTADQFLGYTEGIAGAAYRAGLLAGRDTGNSVEVRVATLSEFDRTFVTSREAAQRLGLKHHPFAHAMRATGAVAVAKVKRSFLWKRSDAERAFPGHFRSHSRIAGPGQ